MKKTRLIPVVLVLVSNLMSCTDKNSPDEAFVSKGVRGAVGDNSVSVRLEAEDYIDAYETTTGENSGGACDRGDGVDMETTGDSAGGGCNIGWTASGEWVEYQFDAGNGGTFNFYGRVASDYSGKSLRFEIDGTNVSGELASPSDGWQTYSDVGVDDVDISAGTHTLRVVFSTGDTNLNWIDITGESIATCSDGIQNQGETGIDCGGPCDACEGTVVTEVRVAASSDDAEERVSNGQVSLTSSDLELAEDGGYFGPQTVGIRFDGVDVPKEAVIKAAWIAFTADETDSSDVNLVLKAEAADSSATFTDDDNSISSRALSNASVDWAPEAWSLVEEVHQTPDISSLVQEIVDRDGWSSGNALTVIVSGSGERTAESYDGDSDAAPLLHIEYEEDGCVPLTCETAGAECGAVDDGCESTLDCGGCDDGEVCNSNVCEAGPTCDDGVKNGDESDIDCGGSCLEKCEDFEDCFIDADCKSGVCIDTACVPASCDDGVKNGDETGVDCGGSCDACEQEITTEVRVNASSDDAEEPLSNGIVNLTSTDLELAEQGSASRAQYVGIRFSQLSVPKGATISSAWVEFTVDEVDSGEVDLLIQAENVDNAATFVDTALNVSSRERTTAEVSWSPDAWTVVGDKHQTPDISALVQEVIDRSGWASGNALSIIISGSGERTAESYNGRPDSAPLLHVEYTEGGVCVPETCESLGAECGSVDDGCGNELTCGTCGENEICDENVCECQPTTCEAQGAACGTISDGCDGTLDCGTCAEGLECNEFNQCGCVPTTCEAEGAECGTIDNGCDGTLDCGGCGENEICDENECECIVTTCEAEGAVCGTISDGCGGTLTCGTCGDGEQCNASNQCECAPTTCEVEGAQCGTIPDGCEGTLDCGGCAGANEVCDENVCECVQTTCEDEGAVCGTIPDGCGDTLTCGTCPDGQQCGETHQCEAEPTCDDLVKNGDETDVDCGGSCPSACDDNKGCLAGTDCVSKVCMNEICEPATCEDGIMNGNETDVDCGGDVCDPCVEADIPGRVEAENYVTAHDSDDVNEGAADSPDCDRGDGVDMGENEDTGGSCTVGWTASGEWLEFELQVNETANFDIVARAGSGTDDGAFRVELDGTDISGTIHTNNIGWTNYENLDVAADIEIEAGTHTMRVVFLGSMNLNWIEFSEVGECIPETCDSVSAECGTVDDGCGASLDCGTCGDGETCNTSNQCVQEGEGCTCPGGCDAVSNQTSPFTMDGVDDSCYFFTNMGQYVNSWNNESVDINGNDFTNIYVSSSQYPAKVDGGYYVYVKSNVDWGHLEVRD